MEKFKGGFELWKKGGEQRHPFSSCAIGHIGNTSRNVVISTINGVPKEGFQVIFVKELSVIISGKYNVIVTLSRVIAKRL
jgi:hypothetical protein